MASEPGGALYGNSEQDKWLDWCQGIKRRPSQSSTALSRRLCRAECVVSGPQWWPLQSVSPLSSGTGGLWLIEMQGTGWQAAAAAYRQSPAEKGRRDGGGGWGKTNKRRYPLPPPPSLWSSNSLILNLRPPPFSSDSHHSHTHAQFIQLPLAPFLSSPSHEWPDGDKTQQQPPAGSPTTGSSQSECVRIVYLVPDDYGGPLCSKIIVLEILIKPFKVRKDRTQERKEWHATELSV